MQDWHGVLCVIGWMQKEAAWVSAICTGVSFPISTAQPLTVPARLALPVLGPFPWGVDFLRNCCPWPKSVFQGLQHRTLLPHPMGPVQTWPARSNRGHTLTKGPWASHVIPFFILCTHTMSWQMEVPAQGESWCRQSHGLLVLPDRCFIASDLVVCPSAIFSSLEHQSQPSYPMWQIKSMRTVPAWFLLLPWLVSGSSMR